LADNTRFADAAAVLVLFVTLVTPS
jgi:hypothetical protein